MQQFAGPVSVVHLLCQVVSSIAAMIATVLDRLSGDKLKAGCLGSRRNCFVSQSGAYLKLDENESRKSGPVILTGRRGKSARF